MRAVSPHVFLPYLPLLNGYLHTVPAFECLYVLSCWPAFLLCCSIISGERLTEADGLDSAEWQEAWSGSDDGDELDQLEVGGCAFSSTLRPILSPPHLIVFVFITPHYTVEIPVGH